MRVRTEIDEIHAKKLKQITADVHDFLMKKIKDSEMFMGIQLPTALNIAGIMTSGLLKIICMTYDADEIAERKYFMRMLKTYMEEIEHNLNYEE